MIRAELARLAGRSFIASVVIASFSIEAFAQNSTTEPDLSASSGTAASGTAASPILETVEVTAPRVALTEPAGTFATPVTPLRYEPFVDLQSRNLAEAQSDLVIRGGTFDTSGVKIGSSVLYDPQTGHYTTEIPVDPAMLSQPQVLTGLENAVTGFNAGTGTVGYGWSSIDKNRLEASGGVGDFSTNVQRLYGAAHNVLGSNAPGWNADASYSRSESSGTRPRGSSNFHRGSLRLQNKTDSSQTDLMAGYQEKSFQWPYLYALRQLHEAIGSAGIEGEDLATTLFIANHRMKYGQGSYVELGGYFRRHRDDYELDVDRPGLFNPFVHTTEVWNASVRGEQKAGAFSLNWSGQIMGDDINSTALTFGEFNSRQYTKLSLLPTYTHKISSTRALILQLGTTLDETNRDGSYVAPVGSIALEDQLESGATMRYYAEISQASQVANYTALNSNSAAGLFRGNADLARAISTNYEIGTRYREGTMELRGGLFYREDRNQSDWVFQQGIAPFASRSAANVDVATYGVEALARKDFGRIEPIIGYTYFEKNSEYGISDVNASFYALNYPRHRVTAALITKPTDWLTLRSDNEFRKQEPNSLRTSSDTTYLISSASATVSCPSWQGVDLSAVVDNIGNENFEEVPGVPAQRRLGLVRLTFRM